MSYSHCDKHDVEATNGCEACAEDDECSAMAIQDALEEVGAVWCGPECHDKDGFWGSHVTMTVKQVQQLLVLTSERYQLSKLTLLPKETE